MVGFRDCTGERQEGRKTAKARPKMSVFRPTYTVNGEKRVSDIWWYKFTFAGQVIRESSKSDSKTVAKDAERARRREMELAINRIPRENTSFDFRKAKEFGNRKYANRTNTLTAWKKLQRCSTSCRNLLARSAQSRRSPD